MNTRTRLFAKTAATAAAIASSLLLAATPASATHDVLTEIDTSSIAPAFGASVVGGITFSQYCQVARADVGVGGSGGVTYHIVSHGEAVGADVLDTSISCKIRQGGMTGYSESSPFMRGFAAAQVDSWTTYSLLPLSICSRTRAFTSSGLTVPSPWFGQSGQPCSF